MAYQLSPGVNWSEIDLTTVVPAPSTSVGAFVGEFDWGPTDEIYTVTNVDELVNVFGAPSSNVSKTEQIISFWTSANFLAYTSNLKLVRSVGANARNASDGSNSAPIIKNYNDYVANGAFDSTKVGAFANSAGMFAAKYPGSRGNGLTVSLFPAQYEVSGPNGVANNLIWESWPHSKQFAGPPGTSSYAEQVTRDPYTLDEMHLIVIDSAGQFTGQKGAILERFAYVSKASDAVNPDGTSNYWVDVLARQSKYIYAINNSQNTYYDYYTTVPSQAVDANCNWGMSTTDVKNLSVKRYVQPILPFPAWVPNTVPRSASSSLPADQVISVAGNKATILGNPQWWYTTVLGGSAESTRVNTGEDDAPNDGDIIESYNMFADRDSVDISLILTGAHSANVIQQVFDNVVDGGATIYTEEYGIITPRGRKDCVLFVSPPQATVVNNRGREVTDINNWLNSTGNYSGIGLNRFSSYIFMDSGWKKQYDRFNDVYRWIPLNADMAGLCARTDLTNDAWWSPAGLNRGTIKNVTQLAWNPNRTERDELYKKSVNPVIQLTGVGPVLFGDKTLTSKPSAFDRINVRRLFIVLQKAISNAAKYSLFEFNDEYTRANFVATIEPFLRDVKGRRGIYDYRVVCDETNNTGEVIDQNRFVGDIYIKPARTINYIQLNFVAVRTGVAFSEVVGRF